MEVSCTNNNLIFEDFIFDYEDYNEDENDEDNIGEKIKISFYLGKDFSKPLKKEEAISMVASLIEKQKVSWIFPNPEKWAFDLDYIRREYFIDVNRAINLIGRIDLEAKVNLKRDTWAEELLRLFGVEWLHGIIYVEPQLDLEKIPITSGSAYTIGTIERHQSLTFYITQELADNLMNRLAYQPVEIQQSLENFKKDFPDPTGTAFIMMAFGQTPAHNKITQAVKNTLDQYGIKGLRADDRQYHSDLFFNILTYIYGCSLGVAIFERFEAEYFNPNVSLEVGYMLALGKKVCFLKDNTLRSLNTDLVGRLYRSFDPQRISSSVRRELGKWLQDNDIGKV